AGYVWLPSGNTDAFAGEGKARGSPLLVLGGRAGRWSWGVTSGVLLRPETVFYGETIGSAVVGSGGVAVGGSRAMTFGVAATGRFVIEGPNKWASATTNAETLVSVRQRFGSFLFSPALGFASSGGIGTPTARVVALVGYAPLAPVPVDDELPTPPEVPPAAER